MNYSRGKLTAPFLAAVLAWPAIAGTIEVRVRDEQGGSFSGVELSVDLPVKGAEDTFLPPKTLRQTTDSQGRATFHGLPPGQYVIRPRFDPEPRFVRPRDNPLTGAAAVTIQREQDVVSVELDLWRGVPLIAQVIASGARLDSARILLREVNYDHPMELRLRGDREREMRLVPGRWELELEPPPGFLLTDIEVDGVSVEGFLPQLDLDQATRPSYVTWYLEAQARLWGRVGFEGRKVGTTIEATLVEAGPWLESAMLRGGSSFDVVGATVQPDDTYEMVLPEGRWSVVAVGSSVAGVTPEVVDLQLSGGQQARQDFSVRPDDSGESGGTLMASVLDPDGNRIHEATVEVWPADQEPRAEEPTAREPTRYGLALLSGLASGNYVVAAGHPDFLQQKVEVEGIDPDSEEASQVTIRLKEGATVHLLARDREERPVPGARVRLERQGEEPESWIVDPRIRDTFLEPSAITDATGHAWIRGIRPGNYRMTGELHGSRAEPRFVRFPRGDEMLESVELELEDEQTREQSVAVVPAAGLTGQLACTDGGPMPGIVSAIVMPAGSMIPARTDEELFERAVLQVDQLPLTGSLRDGFAVGPLPAGAYQLGLRPAGYDRWTWALGSEMRAAAAALQALLAEPVDVGMVRIDCGPAILVTPRTADGPPPDLGEVHPRHGALSIRGSVTREEETIRPRDEEVDNWPDRVSIRGMPEGEANLVVTLVHPYFVPGPELVVTVEGTLKRGRTLEVTPQLEAAGGRLIVRHRSAPAARVVAPDGESRIRPMDDGEAAFPSLLPGVYGVEICGDPACDERIKRWERIRVEPLETVDLP